MGNDTSLSAEGVGNPSWLAGYRAAIAEARTEVDLLSGPCNRSLIAPVLQRVRDRLAALPHRVRHAAA